MIEPTSLVCPVLAGRFFTTTTTWEALVAQMVKVPQHQAPPAMGLPRQEYWSGLPFPSPYIHIYIYILASQVVLVVKNLPANAGNIRDIGSIPGSEKSLGGGHDNPIQFSCLENPMDRGAWRATVCRVAKSWT